MRFFGLAVLLNSLALAACTGAGEQDGAGSQGPTTHQVRMLFDGQRYYFEPDNLTISPGDSVKWIMVSGAPHNVEFRTDGIPPGTEAQLTTNMQSATGLLGPMLMQPNEEYTVSVDGLPAGTYHYVCTPHEALGMTGTLVLR